MLLETAAVLGAGGILSFWVGMLSKRPEVAMIGAIIIIGVGAIGMISGIDVQTGEMVVEVVDGGENITYTNYTYDDVAEEVGFPVYFVILVLGAVMLMSSSGEATERTSEAAEKLKIK